MSLHFSLLTALHRDIHQLWEDKTVNRVDESRILYHSIVNSRYFTKSTFVLFLNKIDCFKQKLIESPLEKTYPKFTGGQDYDKACNFMKEKFLKLDMKGRSDFFCFFTCATSKFVSKSSNVAFDSWLRDICARLRTKDVVAFLLQWAWGSVDAEIDCHSFLLATGESVQLVLKSVLDSVVLGNLRNVRLPPGALRKLPSTDAFGL